MTQASVSEFKAEMSKMPATRKAINAVGPYILELYEGGILDVGDKGAAIEINKKNSNGDYNKVTDIKFETESEAKEVYDQMKKSTSNVEERI